MTEITLNLQKKQKIYSKNKGLIYRKYLQS